VMGRESENFMKQSLEIALEKSIPLLVCIPSRQDNHFWSHHLTLADLNAHDLDDMVCYSYLGYLPIPHCALKENLEEDDIRWTQFREMKPRIAYLTNLLILADEYLIESLKQRAEKLLIPEIPPESCACLFSVATSVNANDLRDAAAISFLSNFKLFLQATCSSDSALHPSNELDSGRLPAHISLFFGESIAICDFLYYVLTCFLDTLS